MPGSPRPNKQVMKIFYQIMKTPDELRQDKNKHPSKKTLEAWMRDSSTAQ